MNPALFAQQEIAVGDWTWKPQEEDGGDPSLSHHGVEFWAGRNVNAQGLRQAALDLMKLANALTPPRP